MIKKIRYALEGITAIIVFGFFRLIPLDAASAFTGWLGRMIGPLTRAHRTAENNLKRVLPELSDKDRTIILNDMWDNLGRVIGEYPHLSRPLMKERIIIHGREHFEAMKTIGMGSLYISGHFANWEIGPLAAAFCGKPFVLIYRAANNPIADRLIRHIRSRYNKSMHNKGRDGAVHMIKALKEGDAVGIMGDQKMNDGEPVPFFGVDAMTATAGTNMAIRLKVPVIVARVVRTQGAHFEVTVNPPKYYAPPDTAQSAMADINNQFETWIREYPAQWFWVHNRWNFK